MNVFLTVVLLMVENLAVAQSRHHHSNQDKSGSIKLESKKQFTSTNDLMI